MPLTRSSGSASLSLRGFNPEFNPYERFVNYGPNGGVIPFSPNTHTDYAYGRIDAEVTSKIRVFGSWLTQDQKQAGESLPAADSVQGYYNVTTGCSGLGSSFTCTPGGNFIDPSNYPHSAGYSAPNMTLNTGGDISITNSLVSTTRFGYYFENYHDFGFPTSGVLDVWETNGTTAVDTNGNPLTTSAPTLAQGNGFLTGGPISGSFTHYNSNKATQFDEDIAWFKSGSRIGTHNLKFGYQLHRNVNLIFQGYNEPEVQIYPGASVTSAYCLRIGRCGRCELRDCRSRATGRLLPLHGTYGTLNINDYGTTGTATL